MFLISSRWTRRRSALAFGLASSAAFLAAAFTGTAADAAPQPSPTAYHVDCTRPVQGDGSLAAPWNSLKAVGAHGAFKAGESLVLKRGSTCAGRLHLLGSGRPGDPIVLGAYGPGKARPTIAGGGTPIGRAAVELFNQSYWTIQDLHITNRGRADETTAYRSGVLINNDGGGRLAGVTVQRLKIDSVVSNLTFAKGDAREFGGISVISYQVPGKNSGYDGLRILNNTISHVGRTGIVVSNHGTAKTQDRDVRIAYNKIVRSRGDSIVLRGSLHARIDHNTSAYGADFWPCKQCGAVTPSTANAAIWPSGSRNTVIEYNEVYGEHKLGGDGEAIDVDMSAQHTVVQYNYVHDNQGGGLLFCGSADTTARFNILQNNQQGAFNFIGSIPATNTKIYNNTVYSARGNKALIVRTFGGLKGKGVTFYNNLIYNMDDSGYYVWPTRPKTRSNTYVGVHGIAEPAEVGKGWNDPGLRSPGSGGVGFTSLAGYHPSSPKNDPAGSAVPSSVTKDFFGKRISPAKPPRGAAG